MDYLSRFSLLLLDPGEIYFTDYAVRYFPPKKASSDEEEWEKTWSLEPLKGRLKICSKSIVFESSVKEVPLMKFFLRNCSSIKECTTEVFPLTTVENFEGSQPSALEIISDVTVEMLENNFIKPYKFRRKTYTHYFHLLLVECSDVLPLLLQLHRASSLPPNDQNVMIQAIVRSLLQRKSFDLAFLKDVSERVVLECQASKVKPLVSNPGRVLVSSSALYFQPFNNLEQPPVIRIPFDNIKEVIKRRYLLRHVGLEIFCKEKFSFNSQHLYLLFKEPEERDKVYRCLIEDGRMDLLASNMENIIYKWQTGVFSNYDYLLYLNSQADRSLNDLTQYPVFPWVISDYKSSSLDLSDKKVFRDLSKPIGALNDERLAALKQRFQDMPEPKFLYGSHYSTPGFVVYYLLRQYPQYMLCLQNGKFDHPDRMFNSIEDTWCNVTTNASDFKELIPEFYDTENDVGDFLTNRKSITFGLRHNGELVWDVQLPPWAQSPKHFINCLRNALESDHASASLHHWIDLIFGNKQQGSEAIKADNLFYYLCYEGSIDLPAITDLNERLAAEIQIMEFGQIPKQLFSKPHPEKIVSLASYNSLNAGDKKNKPKLFSIYECINLLEKLNTIKQHRRGITFLTFTPDGKAVISLSKGGTVKVFSFPKFDQIGHKDICSLSLSSCIHLKGVQEILIGSWDNFLYRYHLKMYQKKDGLQAHSDAISCMDSNENVLLTGSLDCLVKVWRYRPPILDPNDTGWSRWKLSMDDLLVQMDHDAPVNCLSIHPKEEIFASGTTDGELLVWKLMKETIIFQLKCHTGPVNDLAWSPEGQWILSCGEDGRIVVAKYPSGKIATQCDFREPIRCLLWDGRLSVLASASGDIILYDLPKEVTVKRIHTHLGPLTSMCLSPDECYIILGAEDGTVSLWGKQSLLEH